MSRDSAADAFFACALGDGERRGLVTAADAREHRE